MACIPGLLFFLFLIFSNNMKQYHYKMESPNLPTQVRHTFSMFFLFHPCLLSKKDELMFHHLTNASCFDSEGSEEGQLQERVRDAHLAIEEGLEGQRSCKGQLRC